MSSSSSQSKSTNKKPEDAKIYASSGLMESDLAKMGYLGGRQEWSSFLKFPSRRAVLFISDVIALAVAFMAVCYAYEYFVTDLYMLRYRQLLPFMSLCLVLNLMSGLYSPMPMALHREFAELCKNITITYMGIALTLFISQRGHLISRGIFLGGWLASIIVVPLIRHMARRLFRRMSWWGPKAVLFGDAESVARLNASISFSFDPVLKPIAWYEPLTTDYIIVNTNKRRVPPSKIPLTRITTKSNLLDFIKSENATCAVIVMDVHPNKEMVGLVTMLFRHVIIIPAGCMDGAIPVLGIGISIGTMLGFKLGQNLLDPKLAIIKRCEDIIFSFLGIILLLPFMLLISLLIMIESPGNPFFVQKRIGIGGKTFGCFKFRSMIPHAEEKLKKILSENPKLAKEWAKDQKLKKDPRITHLGKFMRQTSIDELPQLFNVIMGDMSLVGPRPIVESEISKYGKAFALYCRVRPGITGFWQVSGRSSIEYSNRVKLDCYYIYNWSLIFDLTLLLRTIPAVLSRHGAV